MVTRKKRKKLKSLSQNNMVPPCEKQPQNRFLHQWGKALLMTASYQVFSLSMIPGGPAPPEATAQARDLASGAPTQTSSVVQDLITANLPTALLSSDPLARMYLSCNLVCTGMAACGGCKVCMSCKSCEGCMSGQSGPPP